MSDGTMLLVQQRIHGRSLADLPAELVTDGVLDDLWSQVSRLHAARIAHRDLRLANVFVDEDRGRGSSTSGRPRPPPTPGG